MDEALTKKVTAGMASIMLGPFTLMELTEHLRHAEMPAVVGFVGQRPPAIPEHTHSADAAAFPPTLRPTVVATTSGSTALFIVNGATFRTYFV